MTKALIALVCLCAVVAYAEQKVDVVAPLSYEAIPTYTAPGVEVPPGYFEGGNKAILLSENFELGIPATWTIVDGNKDGKIWMAGTTSDLSTFIPPAYGTKYAYFSDDDAGSAAPLGNEYLIAPAVDASGALGLRLYYSRGYNNISVNEYATVEARFFTGGAWGIWNQLKKYTTDGASVDTVQLGPYLPADSVQVRFVYYELVKVWAWAYGVDNVFIEIPPEYDALCKQIVSPLSGATFVGDQAVTGVFKNNGLHTETFDVVANIYDLDGMVNIFSATQSVTLNPQQEQTVNFGTVTFGPDAFFYCEMHSALATDQVPANDTLKTYPRTALALGDVVWTIDAEAVCGDNQLLAAEYDGQYFYVTGGNTAVDPNAVYVFDEFGTLYWKLYQPYFATGWGWRDLSWDGEHFYASFGPYIDVFDVDVVAGTLTYVGYFKGGGGTSTTYVNRALGYDNRDNWFFSADFSTVVYKFNKTTAITTYPNTYAHYGAAYDTDYDEGNWMWWHSQNGPTSTWLCQISKMNPVTGAYVGSPFNFTIPALTGGGIAGGLAFWEGFHGMDVLFATVQGTPHDYIAAIFLRYHEFADATIDFSPQTLNLSSEGNYVTCAITLEEGYSVNDIDPATIKIIKVNDTYITPFYGDGSAVINMGVLTTRFDRQGLIDVLEGLVTPPEDITMTVRGRLYDNTDFGGVGDMRVTNPPTKHDGALSGAETPYKFALNEAYPNPFAGQTAINYAVPTPSQVKINVYDVNGRMVKCLVNGQIGVGYHSVQWNGQDAWGRQVASGVYFVKLETTNYTDTRKLLLLK